MIKLEDHIKIVDGQEYVPLNIAQTVVYEVTIKELEKAQDLMKSAFSEIKNTMSDLDD